ncbi:hypothetical protein J6590_073416 [Homalodisca vitripennis]|nr:hypothetical protein J6590_073416 [Homalodisca vitripennis]
MRGSSRSFTHFSRSFPTQQNSDAALCWKDRELHLELTFQLQTILFIGTDCVWKAWVSVCRSLRACYSS